MTMAFATSVKRGIGNRMTALNQHAHPLAKALYRLMIAEDLPAQELSRLSGVHRQRITYWFQGLKYQLTLPDLEACFNVFGLTLKPSPSAKGARITMLTEPQPATLEEALELIQELRARLKALASVELPSLPPPGFEPSTWRLYNLMKTNGYVTKDAIRQCLWGDQSRSDKGIEVAIYKLRKRLPPGELIFNIRANGYEWRGAPQ